MKIALVGLGYWGSKLLRNFVSLVGPENVVAIDEHLDRVAAVCAQYPGVNVRASLKEALQDPATTAVAIATPAETHGPLALMALERGRHVFVEKPLASSVEEAEEVVKLAERNELALVVGHTFLFSPRVQWMADYISQGKMGNVHYITSSRLNLGKHNSVTNVLWDLCPHDFSIAFHVLGEYPIRVQALARSMMNTNVPDVAFVNLEFPSGAIAAINVSWLAPKKIRNTVFVGDTSMIVYDDNDAEEPIKVYDKGVVVPESESYGANQLTYRYGNTVAPHIPVTEPLWEELSYFVAAAEGNKHASKSGGRFGLEIVKALEAADKSWRNNGQVIDVAPAFFLAAHMLPRSNHGAMKTATAPVYVPGTTRGNS